MVSQIPGVLDGSLNTTFSAAWFYKKCCVILFLCINIYFLFIVQSLFSRGASSNYFFVRRSSLLPHWCWSLWCWFSFKIKYSDLKNPPWLSCATQIVVEILFMLSQSFQSEISFWMKLMEEKSSDIWYHGMILFVMWRGFDRLKDRNSRICRDESSVLRFINDSDSQSLRIHSIHWDRKLTLLNFNLLKAPN